MTKRPALAPAGAGSRLMGEGMADPSNLREIIEARLDGMDRAISVTERYPTLLDSARADLKELITSSVRTLRDLHEEKFHGIATQFSERDARRSEAATASTKAIDTAFASNAQAIKSLQDLFSTTNGAAADKINALDRRLTTIEGRKEGGAATIGAILGGIGGLLGIVGIIAAVVAFADRGAPQVIYSQPPPAGQSSIVTPIVPQK